MKKLHFDYYMQIDYSEPVSTLNVSQLRTIDKYRTILQLSCHRQVNTALALMDSKTNNCTVETVSHIKCSVIESAEM